MKLLNENINSSSSCESAEVSDESSTFDDVKNVRSNNMNELIESVAAHVGSFLSDSDAHHWAQCSRRSLQFFKAPVSDPNEYGACVCTIE